MASHAQLIANRMNAKKSTGPRTEAGKAKSRLNATQHNLTGALCLFTEKQQAAFDAYLERLLPTLAPADELQLELARRIVSTMFRLAQVPVLETNLYCADRVHRMDIFDMDNPEVDDAVSFATTFLEHSRAFNNLSLYEQRLSRGLHKDLEALRKMQREAATRKPEGRAPVAEMPVKREAFPTTSEEIGFVFSTPSPDPAPRPEAAENASENMAA